MSLVTNEMLAYTVGSDFEFWSNKVIFKEIKELKSVSGGERELSRNVTFEEVLQRLSGINLRLDKFQLHLYFGSKSKYGWNSLVSFKIAKDKFVVQLRSVDSGLSVRFWSSGIGADEIKSLFMDLFNDLERKTNVPEGVWTKFSQGGPDGPNLYTQFLKVPTWETIKPNYSGETSGQLETLARTENPWEKGKLIILSGPPGTGKTFYLRALMNEWKSLFNFVAVSDPERFGADPGYYFALAGRSSDSDIVDDDEIDESTGDVLKKPPAKPKRTLFVMEDAADLVISESRAIHYDKISKLLNITDGLFGQGRQDMFLISFNEDIKDIDPAFLRPGRCLASIRIDHFKTEEATAWLKAHGNDTVLKNKDYSLAELYKILYGKKVITTPVGVAPTKRVGF